MSKTRLNSGRGYEGISRADSIPKILSHLTRRVPEERTVFVNRNLRMENIRYIGFDLDWTLAAYNRLPLEELTFKLTLERLINKFGYPASIIAAEFRPDFSYRGILIDKVAGTVIKMDRHRYVGKAYLGRRLLDASERTQLYRQKTIDLTRERFYHVDTLFELPEVNVFSELVELINQKKLSEKPYEQLFGDIRAAIDSIHADTTLKALILSDLPRFLPRDPELISTLQRLTLGGRKLLLITNSEWYYTDAICSYLFDSTFTGLTSWQQLFDLIIVSAQKPLFFRKAIPFLSIDNDKADSKIPEWNGIYRAGSRDGLMSLLGTLGESVLYIGDHIYGDIRWSRVSSAWRTALITSELEQELSIRTSIFPDILQLRELRKQIYTFGHQLDQLRDFLALPRELTDIEGEMLFPYVIEGARQQLEEVSNQHKRLRQRAANLQAKVEGSFNPTWGSVFKQGGSKSLFGGQVDDFACLYTSRVSNFNLYGSTHYFRVLNDPMPHELSSSVES